MINTALVKRGIAAWVMVLMLALVAGCGDSGKNEVDAFITDFEKIVTTLESKAPDQIDQKELQEALTRMSESAMKFKDAKIQPTAEQAKKIQDLTLRLQKLLQKQMGQ